MFYTPRERSIDILNINSNFKVFAYIYVGIVLFGETITELHLFRFGLLVTLFVPVLKFVVQMVCDQLPRKLNMSLKQFFIDLNDGLWFIGSVIRTFIVSPGTLYEN